MIFRKISLTDLSLLEEYKQSFIANKESIPGAAGLETTEDIQSWIEEKILEQSKETIVNKNFVPATTFLLIDNNTLVGIINVRHELNEYLSKFGGNIGYSIRHNYRRKGLGKLLLNNAIDFCFNTLDLNKILITCDSTNIASEKTILTCGGKFDNIIEETERFTKRFWIKKDVS